MKCSCAWHIFVWPNPGNIECYPFFLKLLYIHIENVSFLQLFPQFSSHLNKLASLDPCEEEMYMTSFFVKVDSGVTELFPFFKILL